MLVYPINVLILAAGNSGRMGFPKWRLPFDKNTVFLEHITQVYGRFGCNAIMAVINPDQEPVMAESLAFTDRCGFIVNPNPERGRFFSVQTGLKHLDSNLPVFVHNVDNPFITTDILEILWNNLRHDFIVPSYEGKGGHPILVSAKLVSAIQKESDSGLDLKSFLRPFHRDTIDVGTNIILANINTISDYNHWFGEQLSRKFI